MLTGEITWDVDLITDIFEAQDAEIILSIPLGIEDKDTWYWRYEKMGHYSVKSAYSLLQDSKTPNRGEDNSGFWRKLWNLKIPAKVKKFLWCTASHCLPTKDFLHLRHVNVDALCPTCNLYPETTLHSLVTCSFTETCHTSTSICSILDEVNTFEEWLQLVFDQRTSNGIITQVMVCWAIWKNQNNLVWKQRSNVASEVVNSVLSILNQWRAIQDKVFDRFLGFMNQEDGLEQWHPPALNKVKVNVDAALFEEPYRYSHALVMRDHNGNLIEAISKCSAGRVSPEFVEAVGIKEARSWFNKENQVEVIVETDCLQVVQLIRSSFSSLSYLGRVIQECRVLLFELENQNTKLRFVKRFANGVAHYLARYSCLIVDRKWRMGDVHPEFDYVLCKDLIQQ